MSSPYKQINCPLDLIYLIYIYQKQSLLSDKLDQLLMLLLANNILCYGVDMIILSEKIEQLANKHSDADLLLINSSPVGLLDFNEVPFDNSTPSKINGLFAILDFLFKQTTDPQAILTLKHVV